MDKNLEVIQGQKDGKYAEWVLNCEIVFCVLSVYANEICDMSDHVNRKILRRVRSIDMYVPHCPVCTSFIVLLFQ